MPPQTLALRAAVAAAAALPRRMADPSARFRNRVRSRMRFGVLRHWLLSTFGAAALAAGSGVVDVGGGGGDVAFELCNAAGVPATIVDPRQPCMWKCVKKLSAGVYHRTSLFDGGLTTTAAHAAAHAVPPQHARLAVTPAVIQSLVALAACCACCGAAGMLRVPCATPEAPSPCMPDSVALPSVAQGRPKGGTGVAGGCGVCRQAWGSWVTALRDAAARAVSTVWTKRGLQAHEDGSPLHGGGDTYEAAAVPADLVSGLPGPHPVPAGRLPELVHGHPITADPRRVAAAFLSCSLLLGLHPDQALGAVLELAAALRKPFAVVPCCVYAKEFPRRRLRSGEAVRSYEQLLQWVGEWPGVRRCELPFSGRSTAFFCTAAGPPAAAPGGPPGEPQ